jgi:error-prone DNA polymerase
LTVVGLVLARQMPASASGALFTTMEDETGHANLVVWPSLLELERQHRTVIQRNSLPREPAAKAKSFHVVTAHLIDLTQLLRQVDERDQHTRG